MVKKSEIIKVSAELQASIDLIQSFKQEVDVVANNCKQIIVTDNSTLTIAQQNLTKAAQLAKAIDEKRAEAKAPYFEAGKQIDYTAKEITKELNEAIEQIKSNIKKYVDELEAKQKEEQKRIEAEAAKKLEEAKKDQERKERILSYINVKLPAYLKAEYEKIQTVADCDKLIGIIETGLQPDDKMQEFVSQYIQLKNTFYAHVKLKKDLLMSADEISEEEKQILKRRQEIADQKAKLEEEERAMAAEQEKIKAEAEQKRLAELAEEQKKSAEVEVKAKIRKVWRFEVVDKSKVILDWLVVDESKVKEYLSENKDSIESGMVINGIKFVQDSTVSA